MIKNLMIDTAVSPLASEWRSKLSFSVGNTDKMNNGNYLYMGHEAGKKRKTREECRATKYTDF